MPKKHVIDILNTRRFLTLKQLRHNSSSTLACMLAVYCSTDIHDLNGPSAWVYLEAEEVDPTICSVSFDINSIIGRATSLAFTRFGINY